MKNWKDQPEMRTNKLFKPMETKKELGMIAIVLLLLFVTSGAGYFDGRIECKESQVIETLQRENDSLRAVSANNSQLLNDAIEIYRQ